mmetsp:Transcript_8665/g.14689  ORF Transcript_8665/g.14689 Transcript_8665/m.14689 type:complete len:512 (-) Transcript_8665:24-1559(-)
MLFEEVFGRAGPLGQLDIVHPLSVGAHAQVQLLVVHQVLVVLHEEFWDELLHIRRVHIATIPLLVDALEHPVGVVELARLELDHPLGVGPDVEADHVPRTAVVRAVEELVGALRRLIIPLPEVLQSLGVHGPDGLGEVPVDVGVRQVEHGRLVVLKDPGHDRVLGQVLEAALRVRVDQHEVVEVGEEALAPLLRVVVQVGLGRHAVRAHKLAELVEGQVALLRAPEHQVERLLLPPLLAPGPLARGRLEGEGGDLESDVHERVAALEELLDVGDLEVEHGLAEDLGVEGLHVDALVREVEQAVHAHQGHNELDLELLRKHLLLRELLQARRVELGVAHVACEVVVLEDEDVQLVLVLAAVLVKEVVHVPQRIEEVRNVVEVDAHLRLVALARDPLPLVLRVVQDVGLGGLQVDGDLDDARGHHLQRHRVLVLAPVRPLVQQGLLRKVAQQVLVEGLVGLLDLEDEAARAKVDDGGGAAVAVREHVEEAHAAEEVLDVLLALLQVEQVELAR